MIVSCPSCRTRYRHDPDPTGRSARCSRCDEVFPFPAPIRSYRVLAAAALTEAVGPHAAGARPPRWTEAAAPLALAAAPGPAGYGIGMDDPTLAPRLPRAAAAASGGEGAAGPREEDEARVEPWGGHEAEQPGPASGHEAWEAQESPLARRVLGIAALLALLWSLGGDRLAVGALAAIAAGTLAWKGWRWASRRP